MTRQSQNFIKAKMFLISPLYNKIFISDLCTVVKNWVFRKALKMVQNETLITQRGHEEHFCFYEILWLSGQILVFTLWTNAQWSNSQKAKLIRFFQGQFWDPYKCNFHLAYFTSQYQFMRVVPLHCRTVPMKAFL